MVHALRTTTLLALFALLTSSASATWYAFGGFEPDTSYDDATWMWPSAPARDETKVYFAVTSSSHALTPSGRPSVNPNVGLLRTQVETPTVEIQAALFGIWKDCNGDGYVGIAESAMREYPSALADPSRCSPSNGAPAVWTAGAHNYNGWVSEFVPILRERSLLDTRHYVDPEAAAWGDMHRPDEQPFQRQCRVQPFARGTLETTGGVLNYIDCRVDLLEPWNDAIDITGAPSSLKFANEDDGRTGLLGHVPLGGPESTEHAAVRTVDCDSAPLVSAGSTRVRQPSLSLGPAATEPTSFSIAGQVNQTFEEWSDDCDASNDNGHDLYGSLEDDYNHVSATNKTQSNWNLAPFVMQRGAAPFLVVGGGAAGVPQDGGQGQGGTRWLADATWTKPGPRALRYDLDDASVKIAPAYWLTFYANVGSATTSRGFALPGGSSIYGSWHCNDDFTGGIRRGWNCDPGVWYVNPDGSFPPAGELARLAKPGWSYDLRDADCYDGRVGETGIGVQPTYYGEESCA